MKDEFYMRRALELAKKGAGHVSPNPMVGAVIVKDDEIIAEGYHEKYGELHAERNAIKHAKEKGYDADTLAGSTIYVTLEPCCHYGKTPPCTEAIIENRISRVVIGSKDPNPLVSGGGVKQLKDAGIEVISGVLEEECDRLNEIFFHYIKEKKPFVLMKYAMTADGKIATKTGLSQWITSEEARKKVHEYRNLYSAIAVGIGTVLADDPLLTCRISSGRNPVRVICDSKLRIPFDSQIVKTAGEVKTIIACKKDSDDSEKQRMLEEAGCEILTLSEDMDGHMNLNELMEELGKRGIDSLLIEGGGALNWSALKSNIVNKIHTYIAPKFFGGAAATPVSGDGVDSPDEAFTFKIRSVEMIGSDILIESVVK